MLSVKDSSAVVRGTAARVDEGGTMKRIKMIRNTRAGNKSLTMGEEYSVPSEVSTEDAILLCGIGKAKECAGKKQIKSESKKPIS